MKLSTYFLLVLMLISFHAFADDETIEGSESDNDVFFQVGGGIAGFMGNDILDDYDITNLKYGVGIDWGKNNWTFEANYRALSDGNDFSMRGADLFAKKRFDLWDKGGVFVGGGSYLYQTEVDNDLLDSDHRNEGVSPYLSLGIHHQLGKNVDVVLQLDNMFNVHLLSPYSDRKISESLTMMTLSFVLHPWRQSRIPAQEIQYIPEVQVIPEIDNVEAKREVDLTSFAYSRTDLSEEMFSKLDSIAEEIQQLDDYKVVITGWADSRQQYQQFNSKLAQKRAQVVVDYLISKGVNKDSIDAQGKVELLENNQHENKDARKVDIFITGMKSNDI
ncbi:OmpA family protein [Shewanella sp. VB17]|uniref:OmpA family protein n=1 Tax=Shewanella sp. VB17 TaxID=2739432 RepID=UPI001564C81B|nr:OmpA family protein [Shewanella sp. VB17]NRD74169.1 OmpA family protein [Shewanella sp. VB17]